MNEPPNEGQRIDKWLWHARFFKTRTRATGVCRKRRIRINRTVIAKPTHLVREGDVLTFPQAARIRVVRVLRLGERRGPAVEAQTLFEDLDPGIE
ncbi:MAG: RNA-binding S4 domain-containing protein [Proteobacteria bacterium]|nr:RNA-binding S4 domain-containing protein [Pseudomonadota bacterium]